MDKLKKKKKNRSKYLVFDSTDENKKIFEKCTELWDGLKMKLRQLMVVKTVKWQKTSGKIKFDSDDNFFDDVDGYIEENNEIKYLVFTFLLLQKKQRSIKNTQNFGKKLKDKLK